MEIEYLPIKILYDFARRLEIGKTIKRREKFNEKRF
jgi:hypothetical protein